MDIREAACRFCHPIETAPTHTRETFVEEVVAALSAVIAAGGAMPRSALPEDPSTFNYDPPEIPDDAWSERLAAVGHVLADWAYYRVVDPLSIKEEAAPDVMVGDLNDELADIWRDLKEGLLGLEQGGPEAVIRWHWQWGYYSHWGTHATEALAVLHARLREIELNKLS